MGAPLLWIHRRGCDPVNGLPEDDLRKRPFSLVGGETLGRVTV